MTLGQDLVNARKQAGITLDELSTRTNIRISLLKEFENNYFGNAGGDAYARGHLRSIANKVGIDPLTLINLYNEEHSMEHRAIGDLLVENSVMQVPQEKKTISWKIPAAVSLVVLFLFGVFQIVTS